MANEKGIADYDPNEDWEEHLERLSSRGRDAMAEYDEALKHEIWSCQVGDHLVQTAPLDLWDRDDEAPTIYPPDGQIYRVDELKGRCFYLELVSGVGAKVVGIWNADVPKYFRAAPRAEAISNPQQS